jgi:hypothetical protein
MKALEISEKNEIGSSVNSNQLKYASIKKISINSDTDTVTLENMNSVMNKEKERGVRISKLKLFYERDECLIAIQFYMQEYKNMILNNHDYILTENQVYGPVDSYITTKVIDEIILNFSPDEEIYLIKGNYNSGDKRIIKLAIYTTFGQYVEFGKKTVEFNFSWEYYFNLRYFDGFIIGWDEKHINYLASLVTERSSILNKEDNEGNIQLKDTTYETYLLNVEPVYLSDKYGKIDPYTTILDDLEFLRISQSVKDGEIYISEITCYFDKFINCLEIEYTNRRTEEKYKANHTGTESNTLFLFFKFS